VAHPTGHHQPLAGSKKDVMVVVELDVQLPVDDQKQLVGVLKLVPNEFPLDFDKLDVAVVDGGHDRGIPFVWKRSSCWSRWLAAVRESGSAGALGCC
jgi:hypothetical protein